MDKTLLAFGALLHDVGKIVYRGLSVQKRHSELGAAFILEEVAALNSGFAGDVGKRIVEQILFHHAKEMAAAQQLTPDSLAWITYFADNISAGMDRKDEGHEGGDSQTAPFDRTVELRKIFNIINGHNDDSTIEHDDYNVIRERIKKGLAGIELSYRGINSLLNLLEATTGTVPSSTKLSELVDVSLFDHAKTTAGIAACIYDYLTDQHIADYKQALFDQYKSVEFYAAPMFLLYSCDISGIQNFIYNISGSGALKQLRARSLFLEIMLEHIVDELLERLQLSRANLFFSGGGHAYLLLPNTLYTQELLGHYIDELQNWMLSQYKTDLYLANAWVECSANDLANNGNDKQRYGNLYRKLSLGLSSAKSSRYKAATIAELNFGSNKVADHSRECRECLRSDLRLDSNDKCPLCSSLGEISKSLVDKSVFVVTEVSELAESTEPPESSKLPEPTESPDPPEFSKPRMAGHISLKLPFNRSLSVYSESEYLKLAPKLHPIRIYTKNNWHTGIGLATHIWMGDYTADTQNQGISAYALQSATLKNGSGIKRLGVLRADIDNLGAVFAGGLPEDKISISRTATLSRALSYFFKYRINEILERSKYQVQIIYSGGDDLFIVGNWSDIIHAAIDIRNELDEFTGNGSLTISAGIGVFDDKYPIARMAFEVGELEDAAKMYPGTGDEPPVKNAVAFWSVQTVFSWDEFVEGVCPKLRELQRAFGQNEEGTAFIYRIISLLRNTEDAISIPRLAYLLAKSFEQDKDASLQTSIRFLEWARDANQRKQLIAALEWYVYSIREKG